MIEIELNKGERLTKQMIIETIIAEAQEDITHDFNDILELFNEIPAPIIKKYYKQALAKTIKKRVD